MSAPSGLTHRQEVISILEQLVAALNGSTAFSFNENGLAIANLYADKLASLSAQAVDGSIGYVSDADLERLRSDKWAACVELTAYPTAGTAGNNPLYSRPLAHGGVAEGQTYADGLYHAIELCEELSDCTPRYIAEKLREEYTPDSAAPVSPSKIDQQERSSVVERPELGGASDRSKSIPVGQAAGSTPAVPSLPPAVGREIVAWRYRVESGDPWVLTEIQPDGDLFQSQPLAVTAFPAETNATQDTTGKGR